MFYIVDKYGNSHGESQDKAKLELFMHGIFTDKEIKDLDIEIISDAVETVEDIMDILFDLEIRGYTADDMITINNFVCKCNGDYEGIIGYLNDEEAINEYFKDYTPYEMLQLFRTIDADDIYFSVSAMGGKFISGSEILDPNNYEETAHLIKELLDDPDAPCFKDIEEAKEVIKMFKP